jgi:hypothetical protein
LLHKILCVLNPYILEPVLFLAHDTISRYRTYPHRTYVTPPPPGSGLTFEALQIARVSDKAYDAFSRISSRAIDFISCIIFKTLLGEWGDVGEWDGMGWDGMGCYN